MSQLFDNCSCELWKKYSTFVSKGFKLSFCLFFCFVKKVFKANVNLMVVHFVCTLCVSLTVCVSHEHKVKTPDVHSSAFDVCWAHISILDRVRDKNLSSFYLF